MNSKNHLLLGAVGVVAMLLSGCANNPLAPATPVAGADARPCERNFVQEGSVLSPSGISYTTRAFVSQVNRKMAVERASKQLAMDGMQIGTLDKDNGLLTAGNRVIAGNGESVPFVLMAEPAKDGVDLSLKFSVRFGQVIAANSVRENFCKVIEATKRG